jgi:class 3 adenylate cyclase
MNSNYLSYSHEASVARIDEILAAQDAEYQEVNSLPSRDKLSFTNGFYAYCSALFIDIRGSSSLTDKHKRPTLAKLYRAYISEAVALMNGNDDCAEINIEGDAVWGVFDTPFKANINSVFATAFMLNSLMQILNCRTARYGISPISVGIGMSYGRALMIKAGYKGSTINDVVWMGDVVNEAAKLCAKAGRGWPHKTIMASSVFYQNLNDKNKELLSYNSTHECYHGDVISIDMNEWYKKNCV